MMTKKFFHYLGTAMILCCTTFMFTSCLTALDAIFGDDDNPTQPTNDAAQLKQGIWTEYDEALLTSGKYTAEELAKMPTVGMKLEGDKGFFFTYTAEVTSEAVEGKINYNKAENTGTISFPTIKDSPLSNQTVNFSMVSDDVMEFDYTYEGQKITGHCTWLCENLDNWSLEITDEDWKELMAYYEQYDADAGPDASIDWSDSDVEGLDEPLVWNDNIAATRAGTRAIGVGTVISVGAKILGALFEEDKPDPNKVINDKLDAITGKLNVATAKLDQALLNQENMMNQMNVQFDQINKHFDKVNERLNEISNKLDKSEAVKIFNDRNTLYYNKLKAQNPYFNKAYKLYNENKDDLSKVSADLGEYAKAWIDNEQYLKLTWEYIEYLTTVQHSKYGTGMDKIYDGLTLEKYPWEHFGVGDRQSYRAYDMFMITRCLFMINLYATYGGLSSIKKEVIYENYDTYKIKFKEFCEFKVANPEEFLVCQIPGAHFVMHKELQKYNYCGKNNEAPDPALYGEIAVYRPEWHEAGSVKIDNPYDLRDSHLLRCQEYEALYKYYRPAVYPKGDVFRWMDVLIDGKLAAGAVYAKEPNTYLPSASKLLLYDPQSKNTGYYEDYNGVIKDSGSTIYIAPLASVSPDNTWRKDYHQLGFLENSQNGKSKWRSYNSDLNFYAAIVEKRY